MADDRNSSKSLGEPEPYCKQNTRQRAIVELHPSLEPFSVSASTQLALLKYIHSLLLIGIAVLLVGDTEFGSRKQGAVSGWASVSFRLDCALLIANFSTRCHFVFRFGLKVNFKLSGG